MENGIDLEYLRGWLGRTRDDEDLIALRHAVLMAATVEYHAAEALRTGGSLPPLWHWSYFLEGVAESGLGSDGHPARGGFMPPVPLPNRMWAGGRVTFLAPVCVGATVRKRSSIIRLEHKLGSTGDLVFVTVLHELQSQQGEPLIREEQDLVFKGAAPAARTPAPPAAAAAARFSKRYLPTATMLFRYSALTFNSHRIHYDADYCRDVEGYRSPVVHGPLNATMLAAFAEEASGKRLTQFDYRGLAPALLGDTITLNADIAGNRVTLYAALDNGTVCMRAEAEVC